MACLLPQGAGVVGPNLTPVGLLQWQLQLCLLSQVVIVRSKQEHWDTGHYPPMEAPNGSHSFTDLTLWSSEPESSCSGCQAVRVSAQLARELEGVL